MSCFSPRLRAMLLCAAVFLFALGGCASTGNSSDPLEPFNRGVYKFNDGVDNLFVKPAAEIYRGLLPAVVRTGISNFFANINDVIIALNNLLQGKVPEAINDVGRILVNTTLGVFGVMDVATELGVEKHNEDFGQTLGYWGIGSGPYLVLPFVGPSSLRDSVGWLVDIKTDPKRYVDPVRDRNLLYGVNYISRRSELLDAGKLLEVAALDPYEFLRDAYLQRRQNLVYDGNPPEEVDFDTKDEKPKTENPKPTGGSTRAPQPVAAVEETAVNSVLITGDRFPTPAEIEARERADADPVKDSRVVRIWLPGSGN